MCKINISAITMTGNVGQGTLSWHCSRERIKQGAQLPHSLSREDNSVFLLNSPQFSGRKPRGICRQLSGDIIPLQNKHFKNLKPRSRSLQCRHGDDFGSQLNSCLRRHLSDDAVLCQTDSPHKRKGKKFRVTFEVMILIVCDSVQGITVSCVS